MQINTSNQIQNTLMNENFGEIDIGMNNWYESIIPKPFLVLP